MIDGVSWNQALAFFITGSRYHGGFCFYFSHLDHEQSARSSDLLGNVLILLFPWTDSTFFEDRVRSAMFLDFNGDFSGSQRRKPAAHRQHLCLEANSAILYILNDDHFPILTSVRVA